MEKKRAYRKEIGIINTSSNVTLGLCEFARLNGMESWTLSRALREWEVAKSNGSNRPCPISIEPYRTVDGRWALSASATFLKSKGPQYNSVTPDEAIHLVRDAVRVRRRKHAAKQRLKPGKWTNRGKAWKTLEGASSTWKKTLGRKLRAGREEAGFKGVLIGRPPKTPRKSNKKKSPPAASKPPK